MGQMDNKTAPPKAGSLVSMNRVTVAGTDIVGPEADLMAFYLPADLATGLRANSYDAQEMLGTLVEIARGEAGEGEEVTVKDRMASIRMLREIMKDALVMSGAITKITSRITDSAPGGGDRTITAEGLAVLRDGTQRRLSTLEVLEQAASTEEDVIDLEELAPTVPASELGTEPDEDPETDEEEELEDDRADDPAECDDHTTHDGGDTEDASPNGSPDRRGEPAGRSQGAAGTEQNGDEPSPATPATPKRGRRPGSLRSGPSSSPVPGLLGRREPRCSP